MVTCGICGSENTHYYDANSEFACLDCGAYYPMGYRDDVDNQWHPKETA